MSILVKLTAAEAALTELALEIEKETSHTQRAAHYRKLQEACNALNSIRATAEFSHFLQFESRDIVAKMRIRYFDRHKRQWPR